MILYMLCYTFMTFGFCNVITSIFVENTHMSAKQTEVFAKRQRLLDQRLLAQKSTLLARLAVELWYQFSNSGQNGRRGSLGIQRSSPTPEQIQESASNMRITPEFFAVLSKNDNFQQILSDLDVSDEDQLDLFETLDANNSGCLDLEELIVGIAKLRGDARRADVVTVNLLLRHVQAVILEFQARTLAILDNQGDKEVQALIRRMRGSETP